MESQPIELKENAVAPGMERLTAVILPALVRLALLAGPLTFTIFSFSHTPVLCALLCVAILSLWLTVDAGPFRAAQNAPESRPMALASLRNLVRMQWWNGLFCRALLLSAVFYSKLNV